MVKTTRRRTGEFVRRAFEILLEHPAGLPSRAVMKEIGRSLALSETELSEYPSESHLLRFEKITLLGTIAPIKAGWLVNNRDHWALTEEGRRAFADFADPEQFMSEAGKLSGRGWLSVNLPGPYSLAANIKDQLTVEYKAARRIGFRQLFSKATGAGAAPWQEILPLQTPRRFTLPELDFKTFDDILAYLDANGAEYAQGGHTIYLPPQAARSTAFQAVMSQYPETAGLKIIKDQGGVDDSTYWLNGNGATKRGDSVIHKKLTHHHRHLTLVSNLFFSKDLGPRLFDLIEIECGKHVWTAYLTEHVEGRVGTPAECEAGVERMREMEREGLVKVILPLGFDDEEFECPACSGNAFVDGAGNFRYIDFQNFMLVDYESFLTETALQAAEKTHFGDTSTLRGGRYLYQSVPGVSLPGKRGIAERMLVLTKLMDSVGVSVKDRPVLDVGCNIGMMMGQYLKLGARWCHGWDRTFVVPHTERLLHALGCTRFSLTGCDLERSRQLEADLPPFLQASLEGCAISYLAVRGHLGWLEALGHLPWSFMIYEGHEDETQAEFAEHMAQLREMVNFRVGGTSEYRDGDSDPRAVAILIREDS